jgi:hypothetical protein
MSNRVADLVIETLRAAGVRSCYGIVTLNRIAHSIDCSKIDGGPNAPGGAAATEARNDREAGGAGCRDADRRPGRLQYRSVRTGMSVFSG